LTFTGVAVESLSVASVGVKVAPIVTGLVIARVGVQGHVATKDGAAATSSAQPGIGVLLAVNATEPASLAVADNVNEAPFTAVVVGWVNVNVVVAADAGPETSPRAPRASAPTAKLEANLFIVSFLLR
jgi:hypothetical protein